jgi:hypothetical protein
MEWQVVVAIAGLALAILGHAFATIWWAAKVTFSLEGIQKEMKCIKDELKEDGVKKDLKIEALFKRHDELKDRVLTLEQK